MSQQLRPAPAERTGEEHARRSGVRLAALAERFRYLRSSSRPCPPSTPGRPPSTPGRPAYAEAVSSYADLTTDQLRAAALAALRHRP